MCGIGGIISDNRENIYQQRLLKMAASMSHRGPDAETTWINADTTAGFAHRRLCIIDRSAAAGQPMHYLERFTIVYNGEIYNYREVAAKLREAGVTLRTKSDTEVIVAAFAEYGRECLTLFDGMFSFAIWDEMRQELFCARDRFGEKPFYYFQDVENDAFCFASGLRALYAAGVSHIPNESLLLGFIALGRTSDPSDAAACFDKRIRKLPAAHFLIYYLPEKRISIARYWSVNRNIQSISRSDAAVRLNELLTLAVRRRLRSDVNVGMSLSGGLDSSSIAATVHSLDINDFKTFTAYFPGFEKDERERARQVALKFQMTTHFVEPTAEKLAEEIQKLVVYQEEPFTSASVYAQFKVYECAYHNDVTVLLDGQGADEVLAGYDRYRNWRYKAFLPVLTAQLLRLKQKRRLDKSPYINPEYRNQYVDSVRICKPIVRDLNELLHYNIYAEGLEELLRYADRNSMAFGREVRLPFLFHELVDFAFSLPAHLKIGYGHTKLVLRDAMRDKLPMDIIKRSRKIGFEPPQKQWMKNRVLQDLMRDSRRVLVEHGVLSKKAIQKELIPHNSYEVNADEWRWLIAGQWINSNKKGV